MSKDETGSEFEAQFRARTKQARVYRALKQRQVAEGLGIEQDTYKQYETRTPLPHRYMQMFALLCGISIEWLFTGRGAAPVDIRVPTRRARPVEKARPRKAARN